MGRPEQGREARVQGLSRARMNSLRFDPFSRYVVTAGTRQPEECGKLPPGDSSSNWVKTVSPDGRRPFRRTVGKW